MTDDRQRLRQRTVQGAKGRDPWRDTHPGMFTPWVGGVLAMESLLVEAETEIQSIWAKAHLLIDAETDRAEKAEARVRALEGEVKMLRVSRDALRNNNEDMHRRLAAEQEEGPREMNLERVLKASERASEQVAGWPEWKRKLGSAEQEEGT